MKNVILPTKFQVFSAEVSESINRGLKRINRLSIARLAKEMGNEFRLQKHFSVMFRHDFSGKFITDIDGLGMLGSAPLSEYQSQTYRVYFNDEHTDYLDLVGSNMISVFESNDVEIAQKIKPIITEKVNYAIALVKKTPYGNNQYLYKDGSFNTGYGNRYIFKKLSNAEKFLMGIVTRKEMPLNSLKITSSELSN